MKKTILGISFMLMAAFAGSASAQTSENASCANPENCNKEQCDQKKCDKKDCKKERTGTFDCKMPPRDKGGKHGVLSGQELQVSPFKGLNLSDEQKTKVQDLQNAMEASKHELKEKAKAEGNVQGKRAEMQAAAKELRVKYLEDLKKILSPEQYTEFLQNFYVNQSQPNPFQAGARKIDRKMQVEKRIGEKQFDKDKKIVSKEAKELEKSVEKDVKKMEKKAEKTAE